MSQNEIRLHEIVDDDDRHGRSIVEETVFAARTILLAVQMKEHAYTRVITWWRTACVKESPEEIMNKINAGNELMSEPIPEFHVYHDIIKDIMIDMNRVKSARSISRFRTELKLKGRRGSTIIIRLPLEWMDVPQEKIKKKGNKHAV